jgi:hypothetical protein
MHIILRVSWVVLAEFLVHSLEQTRDTKFTLFSFCWHLSCCVVWCCSPCYLSRGYHCCIQLSQGLYVRSFVTLFHYQKVLKASIDIFSLLFFSTSFTYFSRYHTHSRIWINKFLQAFHRIDSQTRKETRMDGALCWWRFLTYIIMHNGLHIIHTWPTC